MIQNNSIKMQHSISIQSAKQLSTTTNTKPQIPSLTPKWLIKFLPWVNVETGIYRINQVKFINDFSNYEFNPSSEITVDLLKAIPLLKTLPDQFLKNLASSTKAKEVKEGDVLIKQGEIDQHFYVILNGLFDISIKGRNNKDLIVKTLKEGDYFGEMAILDDSPRQATVKALTKATVIAFSKKLFDEVLSNDSIRESLEKTITNRKQELQMAVQDKEAQSPLLAAHDGEITLPHGYVDYIEEPKEIHLSLIQTIIGIHTRVKELYNVPLQQLEQQLHITIENIREREEWEIINNQEFGLLKTAARQMTIPTRNGPPTPDDLDDLISLVWKQPSFFLAHPKAIAAFGRECTRRGVPPVVSEFFGSKFITWRGIPMLPCDNLMINYDNNKCTTNILLVRAGQDNQGVVGLHNAGLGSYNIPSLSVSYMGINEKSIANYLVSKYFSVAVHVPDALGVLRNVELGNYYNYQ